MKNSMDDYSETFSNKIREEEENGSVGWIEIDRILLLLWLL